MRDKLIRWRVPSEAHQVGALDLGHVHLQQLIAEGVLREQAPAGARPRTPGAPAALVSRRPALRVHLLSEGHTLTRRWTSVLGSRLAARALRVHLPRQ